MRADPCNAQYSPRQFSEPAASFTDPAATCAGYPERLQPRHCVSNSLRQHSFSGDRASAACTSATNTSHLNWCKELPAALASPAEPRMTRTTCQYYSDSNPGDLASAATPRSSATPMHIPETHLGLQDDSHISPEQSPTAAALTQSKPDRGQDTSIHTRAPTSYCDRAEPAHAPATCYEDLSNRKSIPVT